MKYIYEADIDFAATKRGDDGYSCAENDIEVKEGSLWETEYPDGEFACQSHIVLKNVDTGQELRLWPCYIESYFLLRQEAYDE